MQSIHPISTPLLQHTAFNISQSVKAINQAYTNLGYVSDGPINPTLLHNEHYVEQIKSVVDAFVYELKNHSTSKSAIADRDNRIALIKEIRKANVPVMKNCLKLSNDLILITLSIHLIWRNVSCMIKHFWNENLQNKFQI